MNAALHDALRALGEKCVVTPEQDHHGWRRDRCTLDEECVPHIVKAYSSLLAPAVEAAVEEALTNAGIDLDALFFDTAGAREETTRADACELAAAASLIQHDGWPVELLHMANVPKQSRRKSESGIDIMAATLGADGPSDSLAPAETVYLASVKHTTTNRAKALVTNVASSVIEGFSSEYLVQQLRVLDHVIRGRRPDLQHGRVLLALKSFDAPNVAISGVAAVTLQQVPETMEATESLPEVPPPTYHFRVLGIYDLHGLHAKCP